MISKRLMQSAKQGMALGISLCLLWTSGNIAQAAEIAPDLMAGVSNLPQFRLIPPGQLGRIADYYIAPSSELRSPSPKKGEGRALPSPILGEGARRAGEGTPLVILIQDLHAHYGVQKNISGILEFLDKKLQSSSRQAVSRDPAASSGEKALDPGLLSAGVTARRVPFALAVEGAQGPINSSVLALFPDQKIKAQAADYLMREGELTGAEHFAVMRGIPDLLMGVEDEQYYTLNRELFRKTLADRQELVGLLKGLEADITPLQDKIYGPALRDFQKKVEAYDKGEMSTCDFIALLASSPAVSSGGSIDLKRDFPTLASFAANSRFGTLEQVRSATAEFLTQTQGLLSTEEKKDLQVLAKSGSTTPYYLYMRDLVYKKQLFLAVPPELAQYLEYIHTAQTMGMDRVTHEAKELAFRIKLSLASIPSSPAVVSGGSSGVSQKPLDPGLQPAGMTARNNSALDLVQVQHDLDLLTRIADLQATEYEVKDFGPRLNQFVALTKSLMASNGIRSFDEPKVRALMSSSIDYYAMALMRNKPMIDNTLRLITSRSATQPADHQPQRTTVLVAGGFHTAPLTALLRQRNISYIVITPTVDSLTDADHDLYIKRLSGNLLTVEDVLASAKMGSAPLFRRGLIPAVRNERLAIGFVLTASVAVAALAAFAHGAFPDMAAAHPAWARLPGVLAAIALVANFKKGSDPLAPLALAKTARAERRRKLWGTVKQRVPLAMLVIGVGAFMAALASGNGPMMLTEIGAGHAGVGEMKNFAFAPLSLLLLLARFLPERVQRWLPQSISALTRIIQYPFQK